MNRKTAHAGHSRGGRLRRICLAGILAAAWIVTHGYGSAPSGEAMRPVVLAGTRSYPVVDTGQTLCYSAATAIPAPAVGAAFYGQDAQFAGIQPSYSVGGDGLTVLDDVTGLTWQKSPDRNGDGLINKTDKIAWAELPAYIAGLRAASHGGYDDWRLPSIKELYSLIDFRGTDPGMTGDPSALTPFIDTASFDFGYGDPSAGERVLDAQYWSNTQYVSTTMGGAATVFGVNFADGRIKGYPRDLGPGGTSFTAYLRCVRGPATYGVNEFADNGDGTITDRATGLMWSQADSGVGMNWGEALLWVQTKNAASYLGHKDWRLPNAKELQSLLDYTRSPATHGAAAINSLFQCTPVTDEAGQTDYPFYWSSTTHVGFGGVGADAVYVAFGRAMGYMNGAWIDVHGAGAQRSDPKEGNPADYPTGRGPQGDAIRIYDYVRLVRDAGPPQIAAAFSAWMRY